MLHVKTYLAPSAIAGMGLFAARPIEPNTIIWSFVPGLDREFSPETVKRYFSWRGDHLGLFDHRPGVSSIRR